MPFANFQVLLNSCCIYTLSEWLKFDIQRLQIFFIFLTLCHPQCGFSGSEMEQ